MRAPRYCRCGALVPDKKRCPVCHRGGTTKQTYSYKWEKFSKAFRELNPTCKLCDEQGRVTPSDHVHHIVGIVEDPSKMFDPDNLMALCQPCHDAIHGRVQRSKSWGASNRGADFMARIANSEALTSPPNNPGRGRGRRHNT